MPLRLWRWTAALRKRPFPKSATCRSSGRPRRLHSELSFAPTFVGEREETCGERLRLPSQNRPLKLRQMTPQLAINYLWAFWFVTWTIAACWSDRSAKRPGLRAEFLYRLVTLTGAVLLFAIPGR